MNLFLLGLIAVFVVCLVLLGNWQLRRLEWKNTLVTAIETRAFAQSEPAPHSSDWEEVSPDTHAYKRVHAEGTLLSEYEITVKALTELGSGYWVLSPLQRSNGEIIWINRGFVPPDKRLSDSRPKPNPVHVTATGLLRVTEPGGTILQANNPESNRWYSRDVAAFSEYFELPPPAPYFIDADHIASPREWPRGGLTKLQFRNNHLQYALTWYAMALFLIAGTGYVIWLARHP